MAAPPLSPSEQALIDTALALTARLDVQQTCAAILDAAERIYQARSSWVLVHDEHTEGLVAVAFRGPDAAAYAGARIALLRHTIVGKVFHDRQAMFVPDVRQEDRWFDAMRVHTSSLRTVLTVPLVFEDIAIGVLGIDSPEFSADTPPGAADIARLTAIAAQAAVSIRNAQLFDAAEQDRARLRRLVQEGGQPRNQVGHQREDVRQAHTASIAIGQNAAFSEVLAQVQLVAPTDSTVLLIGETGTGKELIARVIHDQSRRSAHPFVAVNCAALPESLVESELFGYEKGAFTGAVGRKAGKFELADRGTMLLDEISDLPAPAQATLLRVLQEREVQPVGGTSPIPINVRLIAATSQELESCMRAGAFRTDLFYRLSVFPIYLPPLRQRREDIPPLVRHFVERFAERQHKPAPELAPGVVDMLTDYDWPGNVRELQNVVERAVILARDSMITREVIAIRDAVEHRTAESFPVSQLQRRLPDKSGALVPFTEAERLAILRALESTGWRISGDGGAAEILGLKPTTLHAKMKKLGIHRPSPCEAGAQPPTA